MSDDVRYAIGLLSGTSCDGVDATCCRIEGVGSPTEPFAYELDVVAHVECPYERPLRDRLLELCDPETGRTPACCRMRVELGHAFADAGLAVIDEAGLSPAEIAAIGSHGHTVWHDPSLEAVPGTEQLSRATMQLGDPAVIAERTGIDTVSDFRSRDVAAGGHGAPLVPFLDLTAFTSDTETRILQNIGGIGNCTVLPPDADRDDVIAFDTGPGNMVIDALVERITDGARTYDVDGAIAARGVPSDDLVDDFLDDPYFAEPPPKTTGRELFGDAFVDRFERHGSDLSDSDLVASATLLTARSIALAYDRFVDPIPDESIVCGGGAYNPTLLAFLRDELPCSVSTLDRFGTEPDRKEGMLFALLAVATLDGVPGNVPGVTGASKPAVLGSITPG